MASVNVDATVCGGFPVLVVADVTRYGVVHDLGIYTRDGRPAHFIQRRMTPRDWAKVTDAASDAAGR